MIATVMGKYSKPYEVNGKKGVSARLSLYVGDYQSDALSGAVGEGEQFIEVKCPLSLFGDIKVSSEYNFNLDDGKTRIKDVLVRREDGAFVAL